MSVCPVYEKCFFFFNFFNFSPRLSCSCSFLFFLVLSCSSFFLRVLLLVARCSSFLYLFSLLLIETALGCCSVLLCVVLCRSVSFCVVLCCSVLVAIIDRALLSQFLFLANSSPCFLGLNRPNHDNVTCVDEYVWFRQPHFLVVSAPIAISHFPASFLLRLHLFTFGCFS